MKIRLKVGLAGLHFSYPPGHVLDLPDDQARRYIAAGSAELAEPATLETTAAAPPAATTAATPKRSRKRAQRPKTDDAASNAAVDSGGSEGAS